MAEKTASGPARKGRVHDDPFGPVKIIKVKGVGKLLTSERKREIGIQKLWLLYPGLPYEMVERMYDRDEELLKR